MAHPDCAPLPFGAHCFYVLLVFWFGRAPIWRWLAASLLVIGAVAIELRPVDRAWHPFAAETVEVGAPPEVEWREVPAGLLASPELAGAVATHAIAAGEPITPSDVTTASSIPGGWWQLAVEVSFPMSPGASAQIVLTELGTSVPALVVRMGVSSPLRATGPIAIVAVPSEEAAAVAQAVARRSFVVLSAI